MEYLNFDLEIERAEQGYRVESDSPVGQACASFSLPFSHEELECVLQQRGEADAARIDSARAFGTRLFGTVFDGELRACLRSSLDEAERQGMGLRIRLRLNDVPELARLPWEYLYDPTLDRYLALSALTPLVRYLELPERIRPLAVTPPLHILVVMSSPKDQAPINVAGEWARLHAALQELEERGLVVLERVPATLTALQAQLRCGVYHAVHFMGHGDFDESTQEGLLLFEDEEGYSDRVSGQELGLLLHDYRSLRLVLLNACEGASTSRTDPFAGVAQCLVRQGLPAVIAMQFTVTCEAAVMLASAFYGALADGYPADAAVAEGRKAMFTHGNRDEWGTPVLYMRAPDGHLFDLEPVIPVAGGTELPQNTTDVSLSGTEHAEGVPGRMLCSSLSSRRQAAPRVRRLRTRACAQVAV
jgi:hypothetical protein